VFLKLWLLFRANDFGSKNRSGASQKSSDHRVLQNIMIAVPPASRI
jgi:hypothetical protein